MLCDTHITIDYRLADSWVGQMDNLVESRGLGKLCFLHAALEWLPAQVSVLCCTA